MGLGSFSVLIRLEEKEKEEERKARASKKKKKKRRRRGSLGGDQGLVWILHLR